MSTLPERFARRLDNVAIVIADEPSPEQLARSRVATGETLYGLYEGIPVTARSSSYGMVVPDRITIFQRSIEADCRSEAQIVDEIAKTILHEVAHHFGIDDPRLVELGLA
ncbi:MAG: metallopeptidase family protein [Chloroflexi bacterium]|nr:metallopeptidase family protein [Chloroflexota bacterium]